MQTKIPHFKASALGHYPHHWVMHITHALEVIGYRCPDDRFRVPAIDAYFHLVRSMHLMPESCAAMAERLTEDRIASGAIVE